MSTTSPISVTTQDYNRLQSALEALLQRDSNESLELLDEELAHAHIVPPEQVAPDVVTMNSEFVYEDLATGLRRRARLVYPKDADIERSYISIFAPLGSALIGLKVGQEISWKMPSGTRRIKLIELCYQPEAAGDWTL